MSEPRENPLLQLLKMKTDSGRPENPAIRAMQTAAKQMATTDEQMGRVRDASGLSTPPNVRDVEASILNAEVTRELALAIIAASENVDFTVNKLSDELRAAATALHSTDEHTGSLATWTMVLAIGTGLLFAATLVLAYGTLNMEPPQVVPVSAPAAPVIVLPR